MYNTNSFYPSSQQMRQPNYLPQLKGRPVSSIDEARAMRRKMYMESHELHKDKDTQMRELESYVQELTSDIMEMIAQATPEEKQMLQQKIMILANKIQ